VRYEECACGCGETGEGLSYDNVAHVVHGDGRVVEDGLSAGGWSRLEDRKGAGEGCR
jgi:hypothetical protein